jgi:hypothetical protein
MNQDGKAGPAASSPAPYQPKKVSGSLPGLADRSITPACSGFQWAKSPIVRPRAIAGDSVDRKRHATVADCCSYFDESPIFIDNHEIAADGLQ